MATMLHYGLFESYPARFSDCEAWVYLPHLGRWREFNSMEVRMHVRPLDQAAFYRIAGRLPPLPRRDLH